MGTRVRRRLGVPKGRLGEQEEGEEGLEGSTQPILEKAGAGRNAYGPTEKKAMKGRNLEA